MAATAAAFYGLRGSGSWDSELIPENWRQMMFRLSPNGSSQILGLISMIGAEKIADPRFHWFEKRMASDTATITACATTTGLTSSLWYDPTTTSTAKDSGDTLYFRMSLADSKKLTAGMTVMTCDDSHPFNRVRGVITSVAQNGSSSYAAVKLLEDDTNGANYPGTVHTTTSDYYANDADTLFVIGSAHPEGDEPPVSVMYDPSSHDGCTQIFRTSLKHTRTAIRTKLRTSANVREARREALLMHGARIEKALLFGTYNASNTGGTDSMPQRTAGGLDYYITTNNTAAWDYRLGGTGAWASGGKAWLDERMETLFANKAEGLDADSRMFVCGMGAFLAINYLAESKQAWEMTEMSPVYGYRVNQWKHPAGTLHLVTHPLLTQKSTFNHSAFIIDPRLIRQVYLDDTHYRKSVGSNGMDGVQSEYLSELAWEVHLEEMMAVMHGIGETAYT